MFPFSPQVPLVQFVANRIFLIDRGFQNIAQPRFCLGGNGIFETEAVGQSEPSFVEPDNVYPFAVLRHPEIRRPQNRIVYGISRPPQVFRNYAERSSLVVSLQLFDVFQKERLRAFGVDDAFYLEKHRSPRIRKSPFQTSLRKGLARESRKQYVEIWNPRGVDFRNVARRSFPEIYPIRLLGERVPLRGKDAFAAQFLKGYADSPDSREKVYEFEFAGSRFRDIRSVRRERKQGAGTPLPQKRNFGIPDNAGGLLLHRFELLEGIDARELFDETPQAARNRRKQGGERLVSGSQTYDKRGVAAYGVLRFRFRKGRRRRERHGIVQTCGQQHRRRGS